MSYHLQCLFTGVLIHLGSSLSLGVQKQLFLTKLSDLRGFDQVLMTK